MAFNPDAYLKEKASSGGGFDPDAYLATKGAPAESESALRGGISGFTAGLDDEITGAVGAAGRLVGVKNFGSWKPFDPNSHIEMATEPLSADEIVNAYRENRDAIRDQQKMDAKTNPKATIAGTLVGAIVSPAGKFGKGQNIVGPLSKGKTFVQGMKTASKQGALFGAGSSDSDLTKGEFGHFAKDTAFGAGLGAAVPPAIAGTVMAAKGGAKAAGWVGKKLFSGLTGVSEGNAAGYLANRTRINAAPEIDQIKIKIDDSVQQLADDVRAGKVNIEQAQTAINDLKMQVRNSLTDAKVDAREAARRAEDALKESIAKAVQPLKDKKAPTQLASEVVNAVEDLKGQVRTKSGGAREVLNSSGSKIQLQPVYDKIDSTIEKLRAGGTSENDAIIKELQKYKSRLMSENWGSISASEAKTKLQALDDITEYVANAGTFDKGKNRAFKGIRSELDKSLKAEVPEYAAAMEPVAKDASLLGVVSKSFGDEGKAIGRLGQVASPRGMLDRQALAQLEQATGKPGQFTKPIDEYTRAQSILKDPRQIEAIRRSLPEYAAYRAAMAKLAKMRPDWSREQLERALSTSREARVLSQAESALARAETKLAPVAKLTRDSTEAKIKSMMRPGGGPIETKKAIEALEKETGLKLSQSIEDRRILDSFSKAATNGSRNTLLWSVIGAVFGGIPGLLGGATFGHTVMDKYGPRVGKSILDGIGRLRENPSVQTIRSLSIPPEVKKELEHEFRVYMIMKDSGQGTMRNVADKETGVNRKPAKGEDKWALSGAAKLGISDPSALLQNKEMKRLLIEASDLPAGSPQLQRIKNQIQKGKK